MDNKRGVRTMKASYDVPAVRYAIRLLELLSESNEPLGVSEISKKLKLNKNMVFRLLDTLTTEGWVCQEDSGPKYTMSFTPFQMAAKPVNRLTVNEVAYNPLKKLWQETGESIWHAVLYQDSALYIQHFDSIQNVRIAGMVGGRYPLHCTAPGKVLLAYANDSVFKQVCKKGLSQFTTNTITDRETLRKHLNSIKSQGYAVDNEEYGKGILCLGFPIFNFNGDVVSTIGVSVSTLFFNIEQLFIKIGPLLQAMGADISRQMGYAGSFI
jgi:DNA-binding IclR family transcriptional regulator